VSIVTRTITLRRKDSFECEVTEDNSCGNNRVAVMKYEVAITCIEPLDNRGFVIAQEELDSFFRRIRYVTTSCEKLAIQCANAIRYLVAEKGVQVTDVSVLISPPPYTGSAEARIHIPFDKD
jgi:hypothetical protein